MGKIEQLIDAVRDLTPEERSQFRARLDHLEDQLDASGQIERLRAALVAGEQSGPSEAFDLESFIRSKRSAAGQ